MNSLKYAVQFGKSTDKGMEGGVTAFPFLYTFVNPVDDTWETVKSPISLRNNLIDVGPVIAANSYKSISVQLDADHMFKMLDVRYTAYRFVVPEGPRYFSWHDEVGPGNFWMYDEASCIPLSQTILRRIRVCLSIGHNGRFLYGPMNSFTQTANGLPVIPVGVTSLQGNETGFGQVAKHYLLPANGQLRFDIYNDNAYDVVVGATIRGLKVRL